MDETKWIKQYHRPELQNVNCCSQSIDCLSNCSPAIPKTRSSKLVPSGRVSALTKLLARSLRDNVAPKFCFGQENIRFLLVGKNSSGNGEVLCLQPEEGHRGLSCLFKTIDFQM